MYYGFLRWEQKKKKGNKKLFFSYVNDWARREKKLSAIMRANILELYSSEWMSREQSDDSNYQHVIASNKCAKDILLEGKKNMWGPLSVLLKEWNKGKMECS